MANLFEQQKNHKRIAQIEFARAHKKIAPQPTQRPSRAVGQTATQVASPSTQLIQLQRLIITTKAQSFKDISSVNCFDLLQGAKVPLFLEIYQDLSNHSISIMPPARELPVV